MSPVAIAELERLVIRHATLYSLGKPEIPDTEYDDMHELLFALRPESMAFSRTDPSEVEIDLDADVVPHDPPMTSIEKANGTVPAKTRKLADWIADCLWELGNKGSEHVSQAAQALYLEPAFDITVLSPLDHFHHILAMRGCVEGDLVGRFVQLYKRDGLACRLYYAHGKLVEAGLRHASGVIGENVTENIKFVLGVVQDLGIDFTGGIQGELYCSRKVFAGKNEELLKAGKIKEPYANERNYTNGSIKQFKDPAVTAERGIAFVVHGAVAVVSPDKFYEDDEIARQKFFGSLGFETVRCMHFDYNALAAMEEKVPELDYLVDGVVLKVRKISDQEELGNHGDKPTGNPHGAIAWKFRDEVKETIYNEDFWKPGRTGYFTPVLKFYPVKLAGTEVKQASGHNLSFLVRNKIKKGCTLGIKKSGVIIPTVEYVIWDDGTKVYVRDTENDVVTLADAMAAEYPKTCPACGHATAIVEGGVNIFELTCPNKLCETQVVRTLLFYLRQMGVKGLGESTLKLLHAKGLKSPAQFYKLTMPDVLEAGLSEREGMLVLANIHGVSKPSDVKDNKQLLAKIAKSMTEKKVVPLWQFISSFGIDGAGDTTSKALQSRFGTLDAIRIASIEELDEVSKIGELQAKSISVFFQQNQGLIDELLDHVTLEGKKEGKLSGQTFVLTGGFTIEYGNLTGKKAVQKMIENEGGEVRSSIGKTISHVVKGDDAGEKAEKAEKLKLNIIDVDGLKKLLA